MKSFQFKQQLIRRKYSKENSQYRFPEGTENVILLLLLLLLLLLVLLLLFYYFGGGGGGGLGQGLGIFLTFKLSKLCMSLFIYFFFLVGNGLCKKFFNIKSRTRSAELHLLDFFHDSQCTIICLAMVHGPYINILTWVSRLSGQNCNYILSFFYHNS